MKTDSISRTNPEWEKTHHPELVGLLANHGVTATLEKNQIIGLEWENKEEDQDFVLFLINAISSIQFNLERPIYDQLEEVYFFEALDTYLAEHSTSYVNLKSKDIPVSKAHQGTTPFEHIVNVVKKLEIGDFVHLFDGEEAQQGFIAQSIINAMLHDWGKFIIAQGDTHQYHAEISYFIAKEIGSISQVDLAAIRFHHIFQLVDLGQVSIEDVQNLFPTQTSFATLSVLAMADVSSVESYEAFAIGGLLDIIRCMVWEQIEGAQAVNLLKLVQHQIEVFLNVSTEAIATRKEYIFQKIEQVREFIANLGENIQASMIFNIETILETLVQNLQ